MSRAASPEVNVRSVFRDSGGKSRSLKARSCFDNSSACREMRSSRVGKSWIAGTADTLKSPVAVFRPKYVKNRYGEKDMIPPLTQETNG